MALVKCKECEHKVSSTAETCPECGARVVRKPIGCGSAIGIIFLAIVIGMTLDSILRPSTPLSSTTRPTFAPSKIVTKCDKSAAEEVQASLRDLAFWQESKGVITFKWGSDWDQAAPHERLGLIRAFADSDACLAGGVREINFYRMGKLVGKASPSAGINLVD